MDDKNLETATLAAGCFWCYEPIYKSLKGVLEVYPGYSGGESKNPKYMEEIYKTDGAHAESVQIKFDPSQITYKQILGVFFSVHDPTSLDKQGNDSGPQYRSEIFYHDDTQKKIAEELKAEIDKSGELSKPILTKISPFTGFYKAEDYHIDFYSKNKNYPYCTLVIDPKLAKFRQKHLKLLKEAV